jgi:hypothetical protein
MMKAARRRIESGIAAAFRIADAAPTLASFGPAATIAALPTSWLARQRAASAA